MELIKRRGALIVVSAPSGAGKTTLCHEVRQLVPDLFYSVSHTTRAPRPGEVNGTDFHFVTEAEFLEMRDRDAFAEWASVHGHYYGTPLRNKVARARLWGLVAKYGWMLWASIQEGVSTIEFDYWSWGLEKYERAVEELDGPEFERLLLDVQRTD